MSIPFIIAYISTFSSIVPLCTVKRKLVDHKNRFIVWLIIASLLSDAVMFMLLKQGIRNLLIAHIYGILEITFLSLFFIKSLRISNPLMLILSMITVTFYLLDSFYFTGLHEFNGGSRVIESILFILYSIQYYIRVFIKQEQLFLEKEQEFWFVSGIFIFFGGAFFSFILGKIILSTESTWILHNVSNILKNLIFTIGFFVKRNSNNA